MGFTRIKQEHWARKEVFNHYLNEVACTYSMTLQLDVTHLVKEVKKQQIKFYPTIMYLLASLVNRYEEFRTALDAKGDVGVFDLLHPSYTVFQQDTQTFTNLWTEYSSSFSTFYECYELDLKHYGAIKSFNAKPGVPENVFNISSIPWVHFSGFNLNIKDAKHLLPIFTIGKYCEQGGVIHLPLAIQVHHAVCDGFHIGRFTHELQKAALDFSL